MAAQTKAGLPPTFYSMNEETGTFDRVQIVRQPLAPVDDMLRQLTADQLYFIPRITHSARLPVHMALSAKTLTLVTRLPFIRLFTWWKSVAASDGKPARIVPVFQQGAGHIQQSPQWTPPTGMALFFMSTFDVATGCRYNRSSLVGVPTTGNRKGSYRIPLPNIYENGKLCLGNESTVAATIQPDLSQPLSVCFDKALDTFQSSPWNTDLIHFTEPTLIENYFSFAASDFKTQIEGPANWNARFPTCSNVDFNSIPFSTLT